MVLDLIVTIEAGIAIDDRVARDVSLLADDFRRAYPLENAEPLQTIIRHHRIRILETNAEIASLKAQYKQLFTA